MGLFLHNTEFKTASIKLVFVFIIAILLLFFLSGLLLNTQIPLVPDP